jgi:hypothetical protein
MMDTTIYQGIDSMTPLLGIQLLLNHIKSTILEKLKTLLNFPVSLEESFYKKKQKLKSLIVFSGLKYEIWGAY